MGTNVWNGEPLNITKAGEMVVEFDETLEINTMKLK